MTSTKLSQQLHRIASQWPSDPFRPHLQLGTFLKALADHPQLTPQATRAARALLENEYAHKYPHSEKIMKPASMPQYYTRLGEGYEKSAQGIARPWWKIFFGIW
ncbi:uncharacterized protein PHACADRAFT_164559 [Phanerochaete carnosa HHB-10118-sp]|uniref:Uncharacterized protein n=1 Tax=Phanerochaete carnosa (strain HHB-10118-sp) TaxID=650164 RepID=K5W0I6_PHACS|nr:uncharacterized protein PHACADRAFT_164559 [Phanerochaete carnosa HHB-10118-sp]EKM52620.1 hypothetical protein PHACADRAFT_164559 [Phanerochaete carnosa HHB-10118-sp]